MRPGFTILSVCVVGPPAFCFDKESPHGILEFLGLHLFLFQVDHGLDQGGDVRDPHDHDLPEIIVVANPESELIQVAVLILRVAGPALLRIALEPIRVRESDELHVVTMTVRLRLILEEVRRNQIAAAVRAGAEHGSLQKVFFYRWMRFEDHVSIATNRPFVKIKSLL